MLEKNHGLKNLRCTGICPLGTVVNASERRGGRDDRNTNTEKEVIEKMAELKISAEVIREISETAKKMSSIVEEANTLKSQRVVEYSKLVGLQKEFVKISENATEIKKKIDTSVVAEESGDGCAACTACAACVVTPTPDAELLAVAALASLW